MGRSVSFQLARQLSATRVISFGHSPSLLLIPMLLLLVHLPSPALALSFNYTSMGTIAKPFLETAGNASFDSDYVELTWAGSSPQQSSGRVFNKEKLLLWDSATNKAASFNCFFEFSIVPIQGYLPADGLAFVLMDPSLPGKTEPVKGMGLGLPGYRNYTFATGFVAVEFDTFFSPAYDTNNNHVGIDIHSLASSASYNLLFNLTQSPIVFCWVDYSSSKSLLEVYATNLSSTKPTSPLLSYNVNLSLYLPQYVTIGFTAATGNAFEHHRIHSWSFSTTSTGIGGGPAPAPEAPSPMVDRRAGKDKGPHVRLVAGLIGTSALVGLVVLALCLFRKRWQRRWQRRQGVQVPVGFDLSGLPSTANVSLGPWQQFQYRDLRLATNNFGVDCLLGEGGFGSVYKGTMPGSGREVAVKHISQKSSQGEREFFAEVSLITRIRHKNLVELKGWCRDGSNLLLVYEYLSNGSLDRSLFSKTPSLVLNWSQRYNILCGLGAAIQYLHQGCEKVIVHRDIKPSNVMLDANYNAKLGDFGLARQLGEGMEGCTTRAAGTLGYMAPETYNGGGRATTMSDVYSYGMVLLEVVCGRKPADARLHGEFEGRLLDWVWELHSNGHLKEASDERLRGIFDEEQLVQTLTVGLACLHPDPRQRPSIQIALEALQGRVPLPFIPLLQPIAHYGPPYSTHCGVASTSSSSISTSSQLIASPFSAPFVDDSYVEAR